VGRQPGRLHRGLFIQRPHRLHYGMGLIMVAGVLLVFVPKVWIGAALGAVVAGAIVLFTVAEAIRGRGDWLVLIWVLIFPLGYYYLTFPSERSIFTLDRAVIGVLIVALAFRTGGLGMPLPQEITQAGIAWTVFVVAVLLSLRQAENPLGKIKELLDVFVFPGVLAWYVIRNVSLRRHLSRLHGLTCLMGIYVAGIGVVEFETGQDLMPAHSGVFLVEATGLNRVNGPFATNNSFALIGLVTLLFLVFLRRSIANQMPGWQRILHWGGISAALATAVMPLFRSVLITMALIVLLEFYKTKKASLRFLVLAVLIGGMVVLLWFKKTAPDIFEYRVTNPSDIYARIAQQKQTLEMFLANPINGVGWGNYIDAAYSFSDVSYKNVYSVGSAHNTLGALLAETGALGFMPFMAAQFLLVRFFWRLRRHGTRDTVLASNFCAYVFLAYWITGMSLTSGYYSDLNMWYMFVVAVLCKYALTDLPQAQATNFADRRTFVFSGTSRAAPVARI